MLYLSTHKTGREGAKDTNSTLTTQPNMEAVMADSKVSKSTKEEKEQWKDIDGYEGYYQISNLGRVKSLERKVVGYYGADRTLKERIKSLQKSDGYLTVSLSKNGKNKRYKIHRLLAKAFIPNPENKKCINHKNGIKTDNRIENLEWVTRKENLQHAHRNGLIPSTPGPKGEECNFSKLTEDEVLEIRDMYKNTTLSQREIAKLFGVRRDNISKIVNRITWRHI